MTPIEYLTLLRNVLVDGDNILGPHQALAVARRNIDYIDILKEKCTTTSMAAGLLKIQTQFAEFISWLYQDTANHAAARYWLDRALQWSHYLGESDLTCYIIARKAQLAGDMVDRIEAVDLTHAAQRFSPGKSKLSVLSHTYGAFGYALRGESGASERAFVKARETIDDVGADPGPWGSWLDASYVEVHWARCLAALGQNASAAQVYADSIEKLPASYHRDRGVYLARQAVAHARAKSPEEAAEVGIKALTVAAETGSGRILSEIVRLDSLLKTHRQLQEVQAFTAAIDDIAIDVHAKEATV